MCAMNRVWWLAIAIALAGWVSPAAGVTLDLVLRLGDASIAGTYDVRIGLYATPIATTPIATPEEYSATLKGGIGFVTLALPPGTSAADTWIAIESRRAGSGLPYTALPQRYRAGLVNTAAATERAANADAVLPESVGSEAVADGAVGAAQADLAAIQARIAGVCAADAAVYQVNADGSVSCRDLPVGAKGDAGAPGPAVFTEGICTGNSSCGCTTVIGTIHGRRGFCYVGGDVGGCGHSVSGGTSLCCLCLHRP